MPGQASVVEVEAGDFQLRRRLRDGLALFEQLLAIFAVLHAQLGVALRFQRSQEGGRDGGFDEGAEGSGCAYGEEAEFRR